MARGAPDYSNILTASPVHRVDDMGEAVVRLGSIDSFNRAGNVIFMESFNFGMQRWAASGGVGDGSIGLTPDRYRSGPFSLEVVNPTTSPYRQWIYGLLPYPDSDTIGMEASFIIRSATDAFDLCLWVYDGETYKRAEVRYDYLDRALYYMDSDEAWAVLMEDVNPYPSSLLFHTLRFVINIDDNQYKRVVFDSLDIARLSYGFHTEASAVSPVIQSHVRFYAADDTQPVHYLDDVIITVNEP